MTEQEPSVLVVDDSSSARETLMMLLRADSYRLFSTGNGSEALSMAAELRPDLILLDVMMPEMDGFEVCRRLRADYRVAEVPILMITALDDRESRLQGLEAGADDFITKPFDRVELRARIRTITRLNRFRRLTAERQQFEWVVAHATDGYLVTGPDDTIRYANHRACRLLGLSAETGMPGARFRETAIRQYRCEPESGWRQWPAVAHRNHETPRHLMRPETDTSPPCWLQVEVHEHLPGTDRGRLIRLRDVTEQLVSLRGVWTFQTLISHKLRTPLSSLLASLEIVKEKRYGIAADLQELLDLAFQSAQRLSRDIARVLRSCDRREPHKSFLLRVSELPTLVDRLSTTLLPEPATVIIAPETADAILPLTDDSMEVILTELLENACKFHPKQVPRVTVSVTSRHDDRVALRICDDGLTLSPDQLERALIPYFQGERYFTGEVPGMGLGLPMIATLILEAGGCCHLANRDDGHGIIVDITLPRRQVHPDEDPD